MKISQMLLREDFYSINKKTLDRYFQEGGRTTKLYVYPKLNAIVVKSPSACVKDYLFCEYSVRGSFLKKAMVRLYVGLCLGTGGLLSSKRISVNSSVAKDMLIYPCNKKYRIFNFSSNKVNVIAKAGFGTEDLHHETAFRKQDNLPGFVPRIIDWDENGYSEEIIDGKPLARIEEGVDAYRDEAYRMLCEYGEKQRVLRNAAGYSRELEKEILSLAEKKPCDKQLIKETVSKLAGSIDEDAELTLTFSHGDLQPGNIWVENRTGKIYIIDWESWGLRSVDYDKAVLYCNLRRGDFDSLISDNWEKGNVGIVLMEDLIFYLKEYNHLPEEFGREQFEDYCRRLKNAVEKALEE